MEKHKVLVSFVEKVPRNIGESPVRSRLLALTSDGKRLVCLQPEKPREPTPAKRRHLIGVLTEKNSKNEESTRRPIRIDSKSSGATLQLLLNDENTIDKTTVDKTLKQKIPRPANAFMLFANEWRKKLAVENPSESNKDISVRLGVLWKTMSKEAKEKYFALAREVDAEHKRKYPGSCQNKTKFIYKCPYN